MGFALNPCKLAIRSLHHPDAVRRVLHDTWPDAHITDQGFTLCGLPVGDLSPAAAELPVAWGTQTYLEQFLAARRRDLIQRPAALSTFIQTLGPNVGASHTAIQIVRVNLPPCHIHLFRFLSLHLTQPSAHLLDSDVRDWLAHHLCCSLDSLALHSIVATPVVHARFVRAANMQSGNCP